MLGVWLLIIGVASGERAVTASVQWWRPKTVRRGCCGKYVDRALYHVNFCMYDNSVLLIPVNVKVKEGESKYSILLLLIGAYLSFAKGIVMN